MLSLNPESGQYGLSGFYGDFTAMTIKNAAGSFARTSERCRGRKTSETLRRLDAAVESDRRTALEQIPTRQVAAVAIEISMLLRLAFEQFLGSESVELMATTDLGASGGTCTEQSH